MIHPPRVSSAVVAFTAAIFLSAALLFVVQPMVGRMILPLLGGTPAVWNTCMVFFQACLLIGYAYAHWSTKLIPPRVQPITHLAVMLLPLVALPIGLHSGWAPPVTDNPVGWVLLLLLVMAGLPFGVVATSGPLLQRWFARTGHPDAKDPYFLYAASNLGSMIALLGYPLAIEPALRLKSQSWMWAGGYVVLIAMTAWCAVLAIKGRAHYADDDMGDAAHAAEAPAPGALSWRERARWVVLAFVPSSYLLGATAYVTSDIAAVPLLWVVPLALYLLSFILVFARRQWLPQRWVLVAMPLAVAACVLVMVLHLREPLWLILALHLLTLFLVSMACHGELARRRPHPSRLTEYYLLLSLGGVLGGAFNALLAPILFTTPIEYPIAIALACLVAPRRDVGAPAPAPAKRHVLRVVLDVGLPAMLVVLTWGVLITISVLQPKTPVRIALAAVPVGLALTMLRRPVNFGLCVAAILCAVAMAELTNPQLRWIGRSFFGAHRVQTATVAKGVAFNDLLHGTTVHGRQRVDPVTTAPLDPRKPTSYYHPGGPVGRVMHELLSRPPERRPRDVAVVGLGTGSLAAYAEPGTSMTFYEIDPLVKEIAENQILFTFLSDARRRQAEIDIVLGDARLTLGGSAPDGSFDLLVLDAFSGDAIPVHLLTRESMDGYVAKMRAGGLIAIHISNRYLNLAPVVYNLARHAGWHAIGFEDSGPLTRQEFNEGKQLSAWVLLARDPVDFGRLTSKEEGWRELPTYPPQFLWTDDFSNIVRLFTW